MAFSKSRHGDHALVGAGGQQGGLVHQVRQVGAGEAGGAAGDDLGFHVRAQRHLAHVDLEDLLAADDVGIGHHHLAVEAAGAQQRGIQHVGTVGGGDQDDALVGFEAVHLDQQLVQGLLALVVAAAQAGAAVAADGVDFVDEDDAGGVLLALLEHVAHAAGADADEHLDEVRAGDGEEGHVGLAGDGAGQQSLTGARRAHQQTALGDLAAEALELLRVAQVFDDLFQFLLGLVDAGDVVEGHAPQLFGQQARLGLAEAHGLAAAALHLAHEENPHADEQQHREPVQQQHEERVGALDGLHVKGHAAGFQGVNQSVQIVGGAGDEGPGIGVDAGDVAALDGDPAHLAGRHLVQEVGISNFRLRAAAHRALEEIEQSEEQQHDDDPQCRIPTEIHDQFPC